MLLSVVKIKRNNLNHKILIDFIRNETRNNKILISMKTELEHII